MGAEYSVVPDISVSDIGGADISGISTSRATWVASREIPVHSTRTSFRHPHAHAQSNIRSTDIRQADSESDRVFGPRTSTPMFSSLLGAEMESID